jgi:hypothetical protein
MESIEHTKLKPLTLPLAVGDDYRIYAVSVGRIQAKGLLAELSRKKYGRRQSIKNSSNGIFPIPHTRPSPQESL